MSPVFAHGGLRLYVLALLADGPRHGYEVIQELEQRFGGLYSPSAGTVYPRLAKLEEEGLVERVDEGRKAVYRITDAGRREVSERQHELAALSIALDNSVRELAEDVRTSIHSQSRALRAELKAAAKVARAHAVPVGTGHPAGNDATGTIGDLERAVTALRVETRAAWKKGRLSASQGREIVDIVVDATHRIRDVVSRG